MFSSTSFYSGIKLFLFLGILISFIPVSLAQPESRPKAVIAGGSISPTKPSVEDSCLKLHQKYVIPLQELWKKRALDLRPENTDGYSLIEDLSPEHCMEPDTRNELISLLSRILNSHSGKIGVVLPLAKNPYLRHVLSAIDARITSIGLEPKKTIIFYDTLDKEEKVVQAIASMVFEHKVTSIIGGTDSVTAEVLKNWGSKLLLPTFLLSEPKAPDATPFVYYAHPTQKSLAKAAVDANVRFGHKRISILSPTDQHSDKFINLYSEFAKNAGLTITHHVPYDSKRFDVMEAAAKKLFRLDGSERKDELKKLYEAAKQYAKDTGTKFNPKMVALQPDVQQDAVLIPDNFRVVRHFAKIFVFLGVRLLPTFGHYEWRSTGIVNPWDPFLNNSYFVDFQGSYAAMPESIRVQPLAESQFFAPMDKVEQADFSMVGWRAISAPLQLIQKKNEPRRKLDRLIPRKLSGDSDVAFDSENTLIWNPLLFKLSGTSNKNGAISLVSPSP